MAFLDVQSSSTPQSLPLLLFSHREGGGRRAGDPGAPVVVPAPASAPSPASSPARSETRSPPLTLISRHITCCSCESPGDVLQSGGGRGGGVRPGGWGGTAVPAGPHRSPRPDFSRMTAVSIPGWMEVQSPTPPPPQPQVCPTPSAGAPGQGRAEPPGGGGEVSAATAERDPDPPSDRPPATVLDHRAPLPSRPSLRATLRPPAFHHFTSWLFHYFNQGGGKAVVPGRRGRGASEAGRGCIGGGGVPGRAPPLFLSEADGSVIPTRAVPAPRGPGPASRWDE